METDRVCHADYVIHGTPPQKNRSSRIKYHIGFTSYPFLKEHRPVQTHKGKKLLILGSSTGSVDLIKHAQNHGAIVYVADYYDAEHSPAKRYADEAVLLSTADTNSLEAYIRSEKIDCVYAGISEFNLIQAMKLSERCNLPFYCNENQWNRIADKTAFRQLCIEHNVPCPQTFFAGGDIPQDIGNAVEYPVIVKPADASSSVGITICQDKAALTSAIPIAQKASRNGEIIIERFVCGYEFTAHYTIYNGKASLSSIDNRYPVSVHEGNVTTIPVARIYPSSFIEEYLSTTNASLIDMCESLGLKYAVMFVQGLYDPSTNSFSIFEGALRGAGECPYRLIEKTNGISYATMILDSMLLNTPLEGAWKDDPFMKGKSCGVISYVALHGTVGSIVGFEDTIAALPDIIDSESRYPVGSKTPDGDTLHQLMLRFFLVCENQERLAQDVDYINSKVNVYDINNKNLAIKFDPARLAGLE